jgi:hypothetical protein
VVMAELAVGLIDALTGYLAAGEFDPRSRRYRRETRP